MTFTPPHHEDFLPPNLPILNISPEEIGSGWRSPMIGEIVETHWEHLSFTPRVEWRITSYFTAEGYRHQGFTNYRVPISLFAWYRVIKQLPRKWWRHYVKHEI